MQLRALILAAGPLGDLARLIGLPRPDDVIICADGGTHHAILLGLTPDVVIGDLDSVGPDHVAALRSNGRTRVIEDPDQRRTDLELAIALALARGCNDIIVLGGLGGRMDHALANLLLPARLALSKPHLPPIAFTDGQHWIRHIDTPLTLLGKPGDIVSVIPLTPIPGLRFEGLLYPANEPPYSLGWQGVSNRMEGTEARIVVEQGRALVIHLVS